MRVELRPLAEHLDHRYHARAKALLLHTRRHQFLDRPACGQRQRAEQLAVVQEVQPQHLGDGLGRRYCALAEGVRGEAV